MSKQRKLYFKLASVFSLLAAIMLATTFVSVVFDIEGAKLVFENRLLDIVSLYNVSFDMVYTLSLVYMSIACVANIWYAVKFYKVSKYNFPEFLYAKKPLLKSLIYFAFLSVFYVGFAFAIVATTKKESKDEIFEYNMFYEKRQKETFFKQIIHRDPKLFSMSMQINILKEKFKNNEINEKDYKKLLNDILNEGVKI